MTKCQREMQQAREIFQTYTETQKKEFDATSQNLKDEYEEKKQVQRLNRKKEGKKHKT